MFVSFVGEDFYAYKICLKLVVYGKEILTVGNLGYIME